MTNKRRSLNKIGIMALSATMLAGGILPSVGHAQESIEDNEEMQLLSEESLPLLEYTYEIDGIPISSPEPLSPEQLMGIKAMLSNGSSLNARAIPGTGSAGTITAGPFYRTYTNVGTRALITAVSAWVSAKLKVGTWVAGAITGGTFVASEYVTPTYVGTWTYRAYDSYNKRYRTYVTLVHYKHSNYSSPKRVQTYPVT